MSDTWWTTRHKIHKIHIGKQLTNTKRLRTQGYTRETRKKRKMQSKEAAPSSSTKSKTRKPSSELEMHTFGVYFCIVNDNTVRTVDTTHAVTSTMQYLQRSLSTEQQRAVAVHTALSMIQSKHTRTLNEAYKAAADIFRVNERTVGDWCRKYCHNNSFDMSVLQERRGTHKKHIPLFFQVSMIC